jgi:hypothetical protein
MKIIYSKWELWIETCGKQIKIGDGSQKMLMSVLGTWFVTKVVADDDSNVEEEEDSGYASDRGRRRESLSWTKEALLKVMNMVEKNGKGSDSDNSSNESESNDSDKKRKGGRTLVFKQAENNSTAKNTRKRVAAAAATESPMAAGKRGRGKK